MNPADLCSKCGEPLPGGAMGTRCPRCLLELGLTPEPENQGGSVAQAGRSETAGTLALPYHLGDYELLEETGRGGMGVVYRARQVSLNRVVALKMMLAGEFADSGTIQRFHREAEAVAALRHPNIVAIHEFGEWQGHWFYSMEYVEGRSLAGLAREGPMPARRAARYVMLLAEAIHYAHARGVLHRDLKPANVLIGADDQPRITDFGLAKWLSPNFKAELTLSGQVLGSPHYISPEQATGRHSEVGPPSDVYSLGAILYHLATGRPPFLGETLTTVLHQVQETDPVSPRLLNPSVPRDLATICVKCLEKEPRRRFASAQELAEELKRFLKGEPVRSRPIRWAGRTLRWCRRNPKLAALGTLVALLAVVVAVGTPVSLFRISKERTAALRHAAEEAEQRQRAEAALYRLELQRAEDLFANDRAADALAILALLLRQRTNDQAVAEWLVNELTYRSFAIPIFEPLRHDDRIVLVEFSHDGRKLLTVSRDCSARVWDAQTGQPLTAPLQHDRSLVRSDEFLVGLHPLYARFSPDGTRVVTASIDNTAVVWDATTGKRLLEPLVHPDWVTFALFSPDMKQVLTACKDGGIRFWDATTGEAARPPLRHRDWVNTIEFSPDGQLLLTSSDDGTAQVWDLRSGQAVGQPLRHTRPVRCAAFSPDGQSVVTGSGDSTARLWNTRTGEPLCPPLRHEFTVNTVEFSPDGQWVLSSSFDRTARLWENPSGQPVDQPLRHRGIVRTASFSPDGYRILTASEDGTARVWDVRTGQPLTEPIRHHGPIWSAQFSPDGQKIVTGSSDGTAQVWDARSGQALSQNLGGGSKVHNLQWSPDGEWLLITEARPKVVRAKDRLHFPEDSLRLDNDVLRARFSPDGKRVITGDLGGTAMIWDARTSEALTPALRHQATILCVQFSSDGAFAVTASADRTARVWSAQTGEPLYQRLQHNEVVYDAQFSPNNRWLVTACADKAARLWDFRTGQLVTPPLWHPGEVSSVCFSPDGQTVLTVSKDHSARLWETRSGKPSGAVMPHRGLISAARFSRDGLLVVTASNDKTARVWDARTGIPACEPIPHETPVNDVDFSPDGTHIVTACEDGTMRIWLARSGQPLSRPLKLGRTLQCVEFCPEGQWVAAGAQAQRYIVEVMPVPLPIPTWLPNFAEAVAGQKLDRQRSAEYVPANELLRLDQHLRAPPADYYNHWAAWFLSDRASRTLSPSSRSRISDWFGELARDSQFHESAWFLARLREALQYQPLDAALAGNLTRLLVTTGPAENARTFAEADWLSRRALALAPDDAESWRARALYLERAGNPAGAMEAIERAIQLGPDNLRVWLAKVTLLEKAGRTRDALEAFNRVFEVGRKTSWPGIDVQGYLFRQRAAFLQRQGQIGEARPDVHQGNAIPPRDPQTPPQLLDFTPSFNTSLYGWPHEPLSRKDLGRLPQGRQNLGGVDWDIRGLIQLSSLRLRTLWPEYPEKLEGIAVRQRCRRLHFLHAADVSAPNGTHLGSYVVHWVNGQQHEIPIVYGQDVAAWDLDPPLTNSPPVIAWKGRNRVSLCVQLFKTTWENPQRDVEIETLDFVSRMAQAAPFLVALTAEP